MPPKKARASNVETRSKKIELTKQDLQGLLEQYYISFEGPQREKYFPLRCNHLFQTIRQIGTTVYEEQKAVLPYSQKDRIRAMRIQARKLRKSFKVSEDEWRNGIENSLMNQFETEPKCYWCGGEKCVSVNDALPFAEDQKAKLRERRSRRKLLCDCRPRECRATPERDDSDDEINKFIFETAIGATTTHGPEDDLDAYSIPMSPDRIIGLHRTHQYSKYAREAPGDLVHTCMKDKRSLLYPFLVLEAKREESGAGFRGIEQQTAFPLRRMLQTQQSLLTRAAESSSASLAHALDPLVWFLCNQGELWKLYAATLEGPEVRVFELWVNNVESEDGSFQLIQIVDFIWTWARDVYRPQIRSCLRSLQPEGRELSPTSTDRDIRSQSIVGFRDLHVARMLPLTMVGEDDEILAKSITGYPVTATQIAESDFATRLAQSLGLSATWTSKTSIQRSDLVACTFSTFELPSPADLYSDVGLQPPWSDTDILPSILSLIINLSSHIVSVTRRQLRLLRQYWTAAAEIDAEGGHRGSDGETVRALFLFRTFCEPGGWQITRDISTLVYQDGVFQYLLHTFGSQGLKDAGKGYTAQRAPSRDEFQAVINEVQKLRNLTGRAAVINAFQGTRAVLNVNINDEDGGQVSEMNWTTPAQADSQHSEFVNGAFTFFEILAQSSDTLPELHTSSTQLLHLSEHGTTNSMANCPFPVVDGVGSAGAVIGIRPSSWPVHCPRFCLFVLEGNGRHDKVTLAKLLEQTLLIRDFYPGGEGSIGMDERDKTLLNAWLKAMKDEE